MSDPISVLNPKPPVTVPSDATLLVAIRQMMDRGVGALLVTNEKSQLVGILTERDFLTKVAGAGDFHTLRVSQYMTTPAETLLVTDKLALALNKMDVGRYRHLPVVDEAGLPVGVISVRDVLRHVTRLCRESSY